MEITINGRKYIVISWNDWRGTLQIHHSTGKMTLSGVERDRALRQLDKRF